MDRSRKLQPYHSGETNHNLYKAEREILEEVDRARQEISERGTWDVLKGDRNCSKLADLTILIDSPPGSSVYTTDQAFERMFRLLGFSDRSMPNVHRYSS